MTQRDSERDSALSGFKVLAVLSVAPGTVPSVGPFSVHSAVALTLRRFFLLALICSDGHQLGPVPWL